MTLVLRAGRAEDAPVCGRICYDAFTAIADAHNFPRDWPSPEFAQMVLASLFSRRDIFSVVAELEGQIVGSNCMADTGTVAGIGPITVAVHTQNGAVGRAMMQHMLAIADERGFPSVRLVQAAY